MTQTCPYLYIEVYTLTHLPVGTLLHVVWWVENNADVSSETEPKQKI